MPALLDSLIRTCGWLPCLVTPHCCLYTACARSYCTSNCADGAVSEGEYAMDRPSEELNHLCICHIYLPHASTSKLYTYIIHTPGDHVKFKDDFSQTIATQEEKLLLLLLYNIIMLHLRVCVCVCACCWRK